MSTAASRSPSPAARAAAASSPSSPSAYKRMPAWSRLAACNSCSRSVRGAGQGRGYARAPGAGTAATATDSSWQPLQPRARACSPGPPHLLACQRKVLLRPHCHGLPSQAPQAAEVLAYVGARALRQQAGTGVMRASSAGVGCRQERLSKARHRPAVPRQCPRQASAQCGSAAASPPAGAAPPRAARLALRACTGRRRPARAPRLQLLSF